jgi:arylformamidase
MDVYLPKNPKSTFPFVMFVHGGYWVAGDRNYHQWIFGVYGSVGLVLAKFGIGTAVISYRLSPETAIEGQVADVTAAKDFVAKNMSAWGSNGKLFLMGHSAGGHLVSLLHAKDTAHQLSGAIALSPILDVAYMINTSSANFNNSIGYPVFGNDTGMWAQYSPYEVLNNNLDQLKGLHIFLAEHDFPGILKRGLSLKESFDHAGHPLNVEVIPRLDHAAMASSFGKKSNQLADKVASIIHQQ